MFQPVYILSDIEKIIQLLKKILNAYYTPGNVLDDNDTNSYIKYNSWGFPGGAVVESLPAGAGDTGSSPGLRRSHMTRSDWAREPQLLSLRVWSLCSAVRGRDSERPAHRDEEWPLLAAIRGSPCTETKTQHSQK